MSHGEPSYPSDLVDPARAAEVAAAIQALAAPTRLRILGCLDAGAQSVSELAAAIGMEPSAVSHQLRVLRLHGLVAGTRRGRTVRYELHDEHVGALLEEAISHIAHLRQAQSLRSPVAVARR